MKFDAKAKITCYQGSVRVLACVCQGHREAKGHRTQCTRSDLTKLHALSLVTLLFCVMFACSQERVSTMLWCGEYYFNLIYIKLYSIELDSGENRYLTLFPACYTYISIVVRLSMALQIGSSWLNWDYYCVFYRL